MLVDNPLQTGFSMNAALEDFFNIDLLAGPSNSATSPSGSSPRSDSSPSNSFSTLPPTPSNVYIPEVAVGSNPLFDLTLDDDFAKLDLPAPFAAPGFDFLSAFTNSPDFLSGAGSGSASSSSDSPASIDPQLVTSPAQSKPVSEFDDAEAEDNAEEDEDGNDLDDDLIAPVKVGGRGKSNRKGTVQSGGVVKRAGSEKKENKPTNMLTTTSTEPDDWRPSPEEYKKMSSKEKRQLRNKISARNFRVRRKEYITTLEGDIAERDRLIDAIRTELGSTKSENVALRQEITALKKALLEGAGRADTPILPPPAPLPAIPASVLSVGASSNNTAAPKSPLLTPNTQKDLPTSPRLGARGFWGGASNSGFGGFGGITPVHTTLMPDLGSVLSGKSVAGAKQGRRSPALQENINPSLNVSWPSNESNERSSQEQQPQQIGMLESFMDSHPFTMKALDPYRMQLWRNLAAQHQHRQHQAQQQSHASPSPSPLSSPSSSPSGLASGLRPHFFAQNPSLSAVLSGKNAASSYPTPPNSPPLAPLSHTSQNKNSPAAASMPTAQQALLASMASQTLVRKLGSAFWDAFAARPAVGATGTASGKHADIDADKVRRVMEGSAVLRVVDVEPAHPAPAAAQASSVRAPAPSSSPQLAEKEKKCPNLTDILEESMRSLTLGKK